MQVGLCDMPLSEGWNTSLMLPHSEDSFQDARRNQSPTMCVPGDQFAATCPLSTEASTDNDNDVDDNDNSHSKSESNFQNLLIPSFDPPFLLDESPRLSTSYSHTFPMDESPSSQHSYQRWSATEDMILNKAVMETSGGVSPIRWKRISLDYFMGLRTDAQCRYRWIRVVNPQLKVGAWNQEEDDLICRLRRGRIMTFVDIAKQMPGRRAESIRDRYQQVLDPNLRKDLWTDAEKAMLFALVNNLGHKWKAIVSHFPGRSEASCRNTWYNASQSQKRKQNRLMKRK